ncbi:hypothetical protein YYC_03329 [Plasmodium yoelii 17X]|uniref:Uncharacterized protein n=1 Tax=Plasmodium yoelii 17X TaxID=1323249 RepID=V7PJR2_PLAYE|nr:hypothetical protein YYC_03329 [Plasmodium yoelii 17X]
MEKDICPKFDLLRTYLPDNLGDVPKSELKEIKEYKDYCPDDDCNTEIEQITIGFLWLLGKCYYEFKSKSHNNTNAFFIYLVSWLSYKLNQNKGNNFTTINDFFTNNVISNGKYSKFTNEAFKISDLDEFMKERTDLLNMNIKDMSKFYDAFKLLCIMYDNYSTNKDNKTLLNSANDFVKVYASLNNDRNIEDTVRNKILPVLSTNYDHFKNNCNRNGVKCKDFLSLSEIETNLFALTSEDTSSSSTGNKLFTVLSIFGAIAFFLGISYKVNNKELNNITFKYYFHYKYVNVNKKIIRFLTFY